MSVNGYDFEMHADDAVIPPTLTKREYFAAMALSAALHDYLKPENKELTLIDYAGLCVRSADALIAALNEPQP